MLTGRSESPGRGALGGVVVRGLLVTARPRQWVKNVLILAAPAAAGVLGDDEILLRVALMVVAFCLLSSGGYLINDAIDAERDRLHPLKRSRPVAAGVVAPELAAGVGAGLLCAGLAVASAGGARAFAIAAAYAALTVSYTLWLKREPIIEMALLAGAFVLRAAAGAAAAQVHLTPWFVVVVSFGALFVVAGKRHADMLALGPEGGGTRETLALYPLGFVRFVWMMSATITVAAYCLWAVAQATPRQADRAWIELSIVPFVLGLLRYAMLIEGGEGGAPEDVFAHDRVLQLFGLAWAGIFLYGVYVVGR